MWRTLQPARDWTTCARRWHTVIGTLLTTHAIPDNADNAKALARVGITGPVFYLLRPAGHVGLCGVKLEMSAIAQYLARTGVRLA